MAATAAVAQHVCKRTHSLWQELEVFDVCKRTHTQTRTYTHGKIHTHTHTYIHTQHGDTFTLKVWLDDSSFSTFEQSHSFHHACERRCAPHRQAFQVRFLCVYLDLQKHDTLMTFCDDLFKYVCMDMSCPWPSICIHAYRQWIALILARPIPLTCIASFIRTSIHHLTHAHKRHESWVCPYS